MLQEETMLGATHIHTRCPSHMGLRKGDPCKPKQGPDVPVIVAEDTLCQLFSRTCEISEERQQAITTIAMKHEVTEAEMAQAVIKVDASASGEFRTHWRIAKLQP